MHLKSETLRKMLGAQVSPGGVLKSCQYILLDYAVSVYSDGESASIAHFLGYLYSNTTMHENAFIHLDNPEREPSTQALEEMEASCAFVQAADQMILACLDIHEDEGIRVFHDPLDVIISTIMAVRHDEEQLKQSQG